VIAVSAHVPAQRAANVPKRTPSTSEIAKALIVSNNVAGSRSSISFENAFDVDKELFRQRLVETEFLAQLRDEDLVAGAGFARHDDGRIARREPDQEKVQHDDGEQNDRALYDPLGNE
jgi:hypothetical protein